MALALFALTAYLLFAGVAFWLDSKRTREHDEVFGVTPD